MNNSFRKIKANVNSLILNKIVAENIYNDAGVLIISSGSVLNKYTINKLMKLGYKEIWIFDDDVEETEDKELINEEQKEQQNGVKKYEWVYEIYKKTKAAIESAIENIIKNMKFDRPIEFKTLYATSEMLMDEFSDNGEILQIMKYLKNIDEAKYSHYVNVGLLCLMMGRWMDFSRIKTRDLICAGLLHEIKEIKMPKKYLDRTREEYSELGYGSMQKILGINEDIASGILQHHEREDGSGYPMGIKGEEIHDFAKIIAIVDTYDNLISHYVHKNHQSTFKVLEIFENHSFGLFFFYYLQIFLKNISYYYIGDTVTLNTGKQAEIVFINNHYVSKPIVKVNDTYIDLFKDRELDII